MSAIGPSLARLRSTDAISVPRPRSRFATRVLLPITVLLAAAAIMAYSARDVLIPATPVWISPVVVKPASAAQAQRASAIPTVLVQAPGWVEPAPYAITVSAFEEGVIEKINVLEGQHVNEGDVVAELNSAEAELAVDMARAEVNARRGMLRKAEAELAAAQARVKEAEVDVEIARQLTEAGGANVNEVAKAKAKLAVMQSEAVSADSQVQLAGQELAPAEIRMREAQLRMSRMQIRAPASGVVLALNASPGMRISMQPGAAAKDEGILRLYDPSRLQVRVDVPLADAAKVNLGGVAEVTTEAVPDHVFRGRVVRAVHEADIQRNTVQFKIDLPDAGNVLKPEMLTRVRLMSEVREDAPESTTEAASGDVLLAPRAAIREQGNRPVAWIVVPRSRAGVEHARMVLLSLGGETPDGYVVVEKGLSPGDRLIVEAAGELHENQAISIRGERMISAQGDQHGAH